MLEHFLISQIFAFFLIFCRVGSGIMVLPGFGETYVSARIRLSLALIISLLLTPLLISTIPPIPASSLTLALLITAEVLTGILIGSICQILISIMHIAGTVLSVQAGVSSAVVFDVTQQSQGSIIGNFLGIIAVVLIFTTNLHHVMIRGITESYTVFAPGKFPPIGDFAQTAAHMVSDTFNMAIQISAPLIIVGTLVFVGAGIISRLMPTMQVFFVIIAPQLMVGFFIIITTFSAFMLWSLEFYKDKLASFITYLK